MSGGYGPGGPNEGANATLALDNDASTQLVFGATAAGPVLPSSFQLDLRACVALGGLRIRGTGTVGDVSEWAMYSVQRADQQRAVAAGGARLRWLA